MMTLRRFAAKPDTIPAATAGIFADLGEARGRQELFTRRAPQRLKALREHALIESAVSSNRIEGVSIAPARARAILIGKPLLRDRDEEEVRGYRDALRLVHERGHKMPVSEKTIMELHRISRGEVWDAGKYKDKDSDIIEKQPDGRVRVRFKTVPAKKVKSYTKELVEEWDRCIGEKIHAPAHRRGGVQSRFPLHFTRP